MLAMPHALPHHVPIAVTDRGDHPENVHFGSIAVVDANGILLASAGDVNYPVFTRSALKPFQVMPLMARLGHGDVLSDADIALLCASHSGEPMHVEGVAALLARIGADETALACGCHTPYFYAALGQTPPPDATYSRLQHNCSGKHAGMLLLAHALGAPLSGYLDCDHPVQAEIIRSVSHFSGIPADQLVRGIDGCGAPNFALPLRALAQAFARLTLAGEDARYGAAPHRVARAMVTHPELVSGAARRDLILMQAGRGDWVSKEGADGVRAIASFSRGIGIAAKCSDGQMAPLMVALVDALEQLGWTDETSRVALAALLPPPIRSAAGDDVGQMRSVLTLTSPALMGT
ncbi:asparaginase [Hydrogenophaga sp.]|uniref:asparaginase n=1 Tax=Hydrogenophaga sp. TaxID=1904254 RepID=UPI0025BB1E47|nr:asparaginase [Hydrogenophaga sp.]